MVVCAVIGFFIVLSAGISGFAADPQTFLITAVSGVSTALFVSTWILCVRRGAYVMIYVFLMMGVGVTVVLCRIFFNEAISLNQCIGFLLLMAASVVMCSYSSSIKQKITPQAVALLILCGLCNGLADFSQKWFVQSVPDGSIAVFNFYTYVFSGLALLIFLAISNKLEKAENDGKSWKLFFVICIMAACLFAYSYFKTLAAKYVSSATLYPLSSGAAIILSVAMAGVFFGEKPTKKCIVGVIMAFAALMIMNL